MEYSNYDEWLYAEHRLADIDRAVAERVAADGVKIDGKPVCFSVFMPSSVLDQTPEMDIGHIQLHRRPWYVPITMTACYMLPVGPFGVTSEFRYYATMPIGGGEIVITVASTDHEFDIQDAGEPHAGAVLIGDGDDVALSAGQVGYLGNAQLSEGMSPAGISDEDIAVARDEISRFVKDPEGFVLTPILPATEFPDEELIPTDINTAEYEGDMRCRLRHLLDPRDRFICPRFNAEDARCADCPAGALNKMYDRETGLLCGQIYVFRWNGRPDGATMCGIYRLGGIMEVVPTEWSESDEPVRYSLADISIVRRANVR